MQTWIADGATGSRNTLDGVEQGIPLIDDHREHWVEVTINRARLPVIVANGPLKGSTIGQLLEQPPEQLLGELAGRVSRFPLLLKFIDVRDTLSVQVHPSGQQTNYLPAGESGKSEAWVVLAAGPVSRIYGGLKPVGTCLCRTRSAISLLEISLPEGP